MKAVTFCVHAIVYLVLCLTARSQAPAFQWVKQMASPGPYMVSPDASGNVFVTGRFIGTHDFDPGPAQALLTSNAIDAYLAKLDAAGNFMWVAQIGGPDWQESEVISIDKAGDVTLAGYYKGVTDFDPGPGTFTLAPATNTMYALFVLKLNNAGNFLWARSIEVNTFSNGLPLDIVHDAANNLYVASEFMGVCDLDPGPAVQNFTAVGQNVPQGHNTFVMKLDPAGNLVWARQLGATNIRIQVDQAGNVYAAGNLVAPGDFDPGPGVFTLSPAAGANRNGFICKLDNSGNFLWAKLLSSNNQAGIYYFKLDCFGNFFLAGRFNISMDADPGTGVTTFTTPNNSAEYFVKLDPSANFSWGLPLDSLGIRYMNIDFAGNVYLTGVIDGLSDLEPGPGSTTLSPSNPANDLFLARYNAPGTLAWAYALPNTLGNGGGSGFGISVATKPSGEVYFLGQFQGSVDFDPSPAVSQLNAASGSLFVLKFDQQAAQLPPLSGTTATGFRFCGSGNPTLTATGGEALNWYASPASTISLASGSSFTTPLLSTTTTYYVANAGCGLIGPRVAVTVTVNPLPTVTAAATKTMLCSGESATLTASGAASYTWNTVATPSLVVDHTSASTYTVSGSDANGCKKSATIEVSYTAYQPITGFSYAPVCEKSADLVLADFVADFDTGGVFSSPQLLVHPSGMIQAGLLGAGTYPVNYTVTAKGCKASSQASLVILPVPILTVSPALTLVPGTSTTLSVKGGASYTWSPSQNLSCVNCEAPGMLAGNITQYCVSSDLNSCVSRACIDIVITCETGADFSVPNAFTPNGDANNDAFCLQGWKACIQTFNVNIFNRWGEKLFESQDPDFCWDGFYKGHLLDQDVFVYTVHATYTSGTVISKRGNISLIR